MPRVSEQVTKALDRAGWRDGRKIVGEVERWRTELAASDQFFLSESARAALTEFGGLTIVPRRSRGPMAAAPVELNPMRAEGESERFQEMEAIAGEPLYPLGIYDNGNQFLAIAPSGSVFLVMDNIVYVRSMFDRALEALLTGELCVPVTSLEQVRTAREQLG